MSRELTDDEKATNVQTQAHIDTVGRLLRLFASQLEERGRKHDASKLVPPEVEMFTLMTKRLAGTTYGSAEYMAMIKGPEMKEALAHHYEHNSHHPEHYPFGGVEGMDLLDVVEMFCDWKAATLRHNDGDIMKSIGFNRQRFKMRGIDLALIFENTVRKLEWEARDKPEILP